jgi:peptidoglycan/xylan/chitin deacetylase (PgdA/CDA1 family)
VLWTDTSGDYQDQAPEYIVREVMGGVENGAIIILHDAYPSTVKAIPLLVGELRAKGYRLVTVSEMLKHLPKRK